MRDPIHARHSAVSSCSCGVGDPTTHTLHHQIRRVQRRLRGTISVKRDRAPLYSYLLQRLEPAIIERRHYRSRARRRNRFHGTKPLGRPVDRTWFPARLDRCRLGVESPKEIATGENMLGTFAALSFKYSIELVTAKTGGGFTSLHGARITRAIFTRCDFVFFAQCKSCCLCINRDLRRPNHKIFGLLLTTIGCFQAAQPACHR